MPRLKELKDRLNNIRFHELEIICDSKWEENYNLINQFGIIHNIDNKSICVNCNRRYIHHGHGNLACQEHYDELEIFREELGFNCFKTKV